MTRAKSAHSSEAARIESLFDESALRSAAEQRFAGQRTISVRGAREHNLKNVDLVIPRDKLVVFTGLSG